MEGYLMGMFTTCLMLLEFKFVCADRGRVYMVTSPESVVMPINDETILTCEMNLLPDNFQWRHYPLTIQEASNTKSQLILGMASSVILPENMYTVEKKTSTLKIKSTSKTVAGDYQCLAHYGASVVASIPGRITITTLQKFTPQSSIQVAITAGNTLVWRCEPPLSNPLAVIDYYKNLNYINPQMGVPRTQSLILPNINIADSGIYKCTANNIIEQSSQEADFNLNLRVINNGPIQAPKFIITPQKLYTVSSGNSVFMECAAVGNPVPKVMWFKNNGALPPNRTDLVPGGLRILNVSSSDDGIYICNHTNSAGTLSHHITLFYNEAPTVTDGPRNVDIKEGENLDTDCTVKGTPEPYISWFVNGVSVINDSSIEAIGNRIYFRPIAKRHAGMLQCFAGNSVGTTYSSSNIKVIPKQISSNDGFDELTPLPTASNHKRRKHKPKKNKGHKGTTEMIPPSRPTITRLNDESVMVRWTVPENNGLPIQFFKTQYRELGPVNHSVSHKGSKWITTNADIPPHIRSYEVNNLNPDHYYRFRIAAVYSNNDNKLGPNSAKFYLNRTDFFLRNPLPVPRLVRTETVNETAIRIFWLYEPLPNVSIDGFFVHYLPADSASDYMKETVEGEHIRSYVIQHLQPSTMYDIKLQSFTTKSASEFTPIMKQSTAVGSVPHKKTPGVNVVSITSTLRPSSSLDSDGQTKMYIIIGAAILGLAVLVIFIVIVIVCLRKHKNKNVSQDGNDDKDDVSHHIQADANDYVVAPKSTHMNGCLTSSNRITITPNPLAEADNKKFLARIFSRIRT